MEEERLAEIMEENNRKIIDAQRRLVCVVCHEMFIHCMCMESCYWTLPSGNFKAAKVVYSVCLCE